MNSIKYIYRVPIIDYWSKWYPFFYDDGIKLHENVEMTKVRFSVLTDFFYKLSKYSSWSGTVRNDSELYLYKQEEIDIIIGLKQDEDGITYIGSSSQLDFEGKDCILFDYKDDNHELEYDFYQVEKVRLEEEKLYWEKQAILNDEVRKKNGINDKDLPF